MQNSASIIAASIQRGGYRPALLLCIGLTSGALALLYVNASSPTGEIELHTPKVTLVEELTSFDPPPGLPAEELNGAVVRGAGEHETPLAQAGNARQNREKSTSPGSKPNEAKPPTSSSATSKQAPADPDPLSPDPLSPDPLSPDPLSPDPLNPTAANPTAANSAPTNSRSTNSASADPAAPLQAAPGSKSASPRPEENAGGTGPGPGETIGNGAGQETGPGNENGVGDDQSIGNDQGIGNENNYDASGSVTDFENCEEAYEAGVAPIRKGEPGYSAQLDRDADGIACELNLKL